MAHNADYVYQNLAEIATGIFLNIDNNMLTACQKAVRNKVIEVCGSLTECEAFDDDTVIGTDSLYKYKNTAGDTVIDGLMNFGLLTFDDGDSSNPRFHRTQINNSLSGVNTETSAKITSAVNTLENKAQQTASILSTDPTIDMCINGHTQSWRNGGSPTDREENANRFPHLLESYVRMIFNSALNKATQNYHEKYDSLVADALKAQSDDEKGLICTMMAQNKDSVTCTRSADGKTVCESEGSLSSLFEQLYSTAEAGITNGGASYVIKTADLSTKLELMSHNSSQIVLLNDYGSMLSLITMKAFYSPGSKICTITTTTSECLSEKEVVYLSETDYIKDKRYEDGTTKKYVCDDCKYKYEGVLCNEYSDPVEKVTEIQM